MSDRPTPTYNPEAHRYSGRRRKARSHNGTDWAPPTIQDPGTGPYCKPCHKRHRWKDCIIDYEQRKDGWYLLWICHKTGTHILEMKARAQQ